MPVRAKLRLSVDMSVLLVAVWVGLPSASAADYRVVAETSEERVDFVLTADGDGNLYGTSSSSHEQGVNGDVFVLDARSGYMQEKILYRFLDKSTMIGETPLAPVTFAGEKMFSEAAQGGVNGGGTIFGLGTPGNITPTVLHDFKAPKAPDSDGFGPVGGLVQGFSNRYFGVASNGGANGFGTIFSISLSGTEPSFKLLHSFGGAGDGKYPTIGPIVDDPTGRVFGETVNGGMNNLGAVYMLQQVDGDWQEQVIYSFSADPDLNYPNANLVIDAAGNLYGCANGGKHGQGGVFRLSPPPAQAGGAWQETILYAFGNTPKEPMATANSQGGPGCGIALDPNGMIFGTSFAGGKHGWGTIFSLRKHAAPSVPWHLHIIHSFYGNTKLDGASPIAAPFKLGHTYYGGNSVNGAIYAFTPDQSGQ